MPKNIPARLHLLPARAVPYVVIIRRKPTDWTHVIRWNTVTDEFEHGAWLNGKIYHFRSDVSFDGQWLVYFAMGMKACVWDEVCPVLSPKRSIDARQSGTYFGGGYWSTQNTLMCNGWGLGLRPENFPFATDTYCGSMEDEGVLPLRLERDGWRRAGPFGVERKVVEAKKYTVVCENDPGWFWRPTQGHPMLRMYYRGYLERGRTYEFALDEYPKLLGPGVDWATWDSLGQLIVARKGGVERYTLEDLARGTPTFQQSFEDLQPPGEEQPA